MVEVEPANSVAHQTPAHLQAVPEGLVAGAGRDSVEPQVEELELGGEAVNLGKKYLCFNFILSSSPRCPILITASNKIKNK